MKGCGQPAATSYLYDLHQEVQRLWAKRTGRSRQSEGREGASERGMFINSIKGGCLDYSACRWNAVWYSVRRLCPAPPPGRRNDAAARSLEMQPVCTRSARARACRKELGRHWLSSLATSSARPIRARVTRIVRAILVARLPWLSPQSRDATRGGAGSHSPRVADTVPVFRYLADEPAYPLIGRRGGFTAPRILEIGCAGLRAPGGATAHDSPAPRQTRPAGGGGARR